MNDPERLAALLDGRLKGREREEAIARLAASDEDFEAYADALAISAELNAEEEGVTPITARPRRALARRWLAMAAVLAGVALAPWLWTRYTARTDPARFAAEIEAGGLPAGWDASPWGATRGPGDAIAPDARAVRLGARLVDLELAVRARSPAAAALASETAMLLEGIPASGPTATIYREIARRAAEPPEQLEPLLAQGRELVPLLAGVERVELGAWTEAARIAAARGDRDFFESRAARSQLERMAGTPGLEPSARTALERIRAGLESEPADLRAVERDATALLGLLGG
jgi:hypothetical protein